VELTPVNFGGIGDQDGLVLYWLILGFVKGEFNLLPGETSSESMGVANTCGRLGEKQN
jgi:hypothetical protein